MKTIDARSFAALALLVTVVGCSGAGEGEPRRVRVPPGAGLSQVVDSLTRHEVIGSPTLFKLYARAVGAADEVQAGTYAFRRDMGWKTVLEDLINGRVAADRLTIPEGWDLRLIAPRIGQLTGVDADSVLGLLVDSATVARLSVPGPTMEGYLYPATYTMPADSPLDSIIGWMTREYHRVWTPERRARADSIGMSQREVVTLASIVEKEAKVRDEMQQIAAVYLNRLELGYPLQADPTVQYALGEHQTRLLYEHIDSVADNPYNTYRHRGLPPGPIASPSRAAIDAVLHPADVDYLYFVARADGRHVFNRHLTDHNRARNRIRQEEARRQSTAGDSSDGG